MNYEISANVVIVLEISKINQVIFIGSDANHAKIVETQRAASLRFF